MAKEKGVHRSVGCLFRIERLRQEPVTINKHETVHALGVNLSLAYSLVVKFGGFYLSENKSVKLS